MKNNNILVISCRTVENELQSAMNECHKNYDIVWIEARLHNNKSKLLNALQDILNNYPTYETVLMATGFCGNSVVGLNSENARLIIPRVDDCISLLLGSVENRRRYNDAYFLTEGWLSSDPNIWFEYNYTVKKYGKELADQIYQTLFAHYRRIALLDTACYHIEPSLEKARMIAKAFSLNCDIIPGTTDYLKALLCGPWDEHRFLIIPPHTVISSTDTMDLC